MLVHGAEAVDDAEAVDGGVLVHGAVLAGGVLADGVLADGIAAMVGAAGLPDSVESGARVGVAVESGDTYAWRAAVCPSGVVAVTLAGAGATDGTLVAACRAAVAMAMGWVACGALAVRAAVGGRSAMVGDRLACACARTGRGWSFVTPRRRRADGPWR